jgi:hemoglobin-like flavoprotein
MCAHRKFVLGNLTEADVAIIGSTFEMVENRGDEFAVLFYNHLFEIAPVKHLFKNVDDVKVQGKKLIMTLKTAIKVIRKPETLVPTLQALGARHVAYGVANEHYKPVGESLVWTLRQLLGNEFTAHAAEAWSKVYTIMADVCMKAADEQMAKDQAAKEAAGSQKFVLGNLTEVDVALIASSFEKVESRGDEFAVLFYNHLFEIAPVRHLFKNVSDVKVQGKKLIMTLKTAIKVIRKPETLVPTLQALGARHVAYGVKNEHYKPVGESLVWTLGQLLGREFTPAAAEAWTKVYVIMADVCMKAADEQMAKESATKAASFQASSPLSAGLGAGLVLGLGVGILLGYVLASKGLRLA